MKRNNAVQFKKGWYNIVLNEEEFLYLKTHLKVNISTIERRNRNLKVDIKNNLNRESYTKELVLNEALIAMFQDALNGFCMSQLLTEFGLPEEKKNKL